MVVVGLAKYYYYNYLSAHLLRLLGIVCLLYF